ncbi:hypothetical protein ACFC09_16765 [Streptomyces sp. NPDC056161]
MPRLAVIAPSGFGILPVLLSYCRPPEVYVPGGLAVPLSPSVTCGSRA